MGVPAVSGLTRDLRHPAADLSSWAHLQRVLQTLGGSSAAPPNVLGQLARLLDTAPDDDIEPPAFGVPFGHWLWTVMSPVPRDAALRWVVRAAATPQLSSKAAVRAVVEALPSAARSPAQDQAAHLGFITKPR